MRNNFFLQNCIVSLDGKKIVCGGKKNEEEGEHSVKNWNIYFNLKKIRQNNIQCWLVISVLNALISQNFCKINMVRLNFCNFYTVRREGLVWENVLAHFVLLKHNVKAIIECFIVILHLMRISVLVLFIGICFFYDWSLFLKK